MRRVASWPSSAPARRGAASRFVLAGLAISVIDSCPGDFQRPIVPTTGASVPDHLVTMWRSGLLTERQSMDGHRTDRPDHAPHAGHRATLR